MLQAPCFCINTQHFSPLPRVPDGPPSLAGLGNGLFHLLHDLCDLQRHLLLEIVLVNEEVADLGTLGPPDFLGISWDDSLGFMEYLLGIYIMDFWIGFKLGSISWIHLLG